VVVQACGMREDRIYKDSNKRGFAKFLKVGEKDER